MTTSDPDTPKTKTLSKRLEERLENQLRCLGAGCATTLVAETLLRGADAKAEAAGFRFIDALGEKNITDAFCDALKKRKKTDGKSDGGKGGTPSVTSGNRQCETPL